MASFWRNIFSAITGRGREAAQSSQPEQPESPSAFQPQEEGEAEPSWLDKLLGSSNDIPETSDRAETEKGLAEFQPQDEAQGLFYLGFIDKNLSPDARRAAREEFQDTYGRLSDEQWARWRKEMGY